LDLSNVLDDFTIGTFTGSCSSWNHSYALCQSAALPYPGPAYGSLLQEDAGYSTPLHGTLFWTGNIGIFNSSAVQVTCPNSTYTYCNATANLRLGESSFTFILNLFSVASLC
jgi:hypothetical protein